MSAATAPMIVDNERPPIGEWEQVVARTPRLAASVDAYLDELGETRSLATVQVAKYDVATVRRVRDRGRPALHHGRRHHRAPRRRLLLVARAAS